MVRVVVYCFAVNNGGCANMQPAPVHQNLDTFALCVRANKESD